MFFCASEIGRGLISSKSRASDSRQVIVLVRELLTSVFERSKTRPKTAEFEWLITSRFFEPEIFQANADSLFGREKPI